MMFNRIVQLLLLGFLVNLLACLRVETDLNPNVLILLADDLGYTDLACFGGKAHSPHLDNLANGGIKFTHFYAPAPNCSPSRTGMLTGRMPSRVGMYNYRRDLQVMHMPDSEVTIAEYLKQRGYQTAHFGKWHLSCLPQDSSLNQPQPIDQGFDYSLGTENNAIPSHLNPKNFIRNGKRVGETIGYSCQLLADEVAQWFKNDYRRDSPFFIYVAFHEVHAKIASPEEMIRNYPGENRRDAEYLANVENMDNAAGRILSELSNRDLLQNTIVIFSSDNGPYKSGSAGNLRGLKGEVFEGGIRVPGIIGWPESIKRGRVIETPSGLIDLLPTLSEVCGFNIPEENKTDGTSLVPLFSGSEIERETPLMWFYYRGFPEISLRMGEYVLTGNALDSIPRTHPISNLDMDFIKSIQIKRYKLYNIIADPGQETDITESESEVFEKMKLQMNKLLQEIKTEGPYWKGLDEYKSLPSQFKKNYIRK